MQDTEKFYPIKGFEDYYEITKSGLIRSKHRTFIRCSGKRQPVIGRIMKQRISNVGYYRVCISISELKINKDYSVHRLVAKTFIPNPLNLPCVNHLDGNKLNNNDWNLEWASYSTNNQHRYDCLGYINKRRVLNDDAVIDIYLNAIKGTNNIKGGNKGNLFFYTQKYNCNPSVIWAILKDKSYLNITKHLKRKGE